LRVAWRVSKRRKGAEAGKDARLKSIQAERGADSSEVAARRDATSVL
jgi:hypothetical protein